MMECSVCHRIGGSIDATVDLGGPSAKCLAVPYVHGEQLFDADGRAVHQLFLARLDVAPRLALSSHIYSHTQQSSAHQPPLPFGLHDRRWQRIFLHSRYPLSHVRSPLSPLESAILGNISTIAAD